MRIRKTRRKMNKSNGEDGRRKKNKKMGRRRGQY
jgi:hypothetical protein